MKWLANAACTACNGKMMARQSGGDEANEPIGRSSLTIAGCVSAWPMAPDLCVSLIRLVTVYLTFSSSEN